MVGAPQPAPNLNEPTSDDEGTPKSAMVSLAAGLVAVAVVAVFVPEVFPILALPSAAVAVVAGVRNTGSWQALVGITLGCLMAVASLVVLAG